MKTTGTASHCKNMAATMAVTSKIIFGILLLKEKFLNFKAIMGIVLTINQLTIKTTPYNTHLFSKTSITKLLGECQ